MRPNNSYYASNQLTNFFTEDINVVMLNNQVYMHEWFQMLALIGWFLIYSFVYS